MGGGRFTVLQVLATPPRGNEIVGRDAVKDLVVAALAGKGVNFLLAILWAFAIKTKKLNKHKR